MTNLSNAKIDDLVLYYDDLVDYIYLKFCNRRVAIEVVQETYLRVLQKPEQFQNLISPIAFLKTVSLNIALDYVKKDQSYQKYFEAMEPELLEQQGRQLLLDTFSEQELICLRQQYSQLILLKINTLPPTCRDIFLLIQFHGMSQLDVARQLGISRIMVAKHLSRALQSFIPVFKDVEDE